MTAFHSDTSIKEKYIARVTRHRLAGTLSQSKALESRTGEFCAIWCTVEEYKPALYPVELGIPEWLARIEEEIFKGLEEKRAMEWPVEFLASIPVGADLEQIRDPFFNSIPAIWTGTSSLSLAAGRTADKLLELFRGLK